MKSFFRRMLEEKELMDVHFVINYKGQNHYMNTGVVLELIESSTEEEQSAVKDVFSKIDFKNGDLMHFIKYLGNAYIVSNYNYMEES